MNNNKTLNILTLFIAFTLIIIPFSNLSAQSFDFAILDKQANSFSVIVEMTIEFSFGGHNNEQEERFLGTVVTEDGMVIFNGSILSSENSIMQMTGYNVKTTPSNLSITTMSGKKYKCEYIGVDRYTKIGFIKTINESNEKFNPIKFNTSSTIKIGNWIALYGLLPDFIEPSLAADVGMVSVVVKSPKKMPLLVGFNPTQLASVLYNESMQPIGVLGVLNNPNAASIDANGMLDSFNQLGPTLLGIIPSENILKLIANPPQKGKSERGWLGITLQALTEDMASFWGLDLKGGIIINDIVNKSPAEKAGLLIGDIIYEVNDEQVSVTKEENIPIFQREISEMGPDAEVELTVIRRMESSVDTVKILATLELAPMAPSDAPEYENEFLEFKVRDMVFADYLRYNLESETFKGVVVSELKQGGFGEVEGLRVGDIIQRIDDNDITNVEEIESVMEELTNLKPKEIIFFVWRNQKTLFVNVKTDWE
jgi:serine protease Do